MGFLDFLTVFFVGGYVIGKFTGETTSDGFNLTGPAALALFVLLAAYFYLGWKKLGRTIWQRILKARNRLGSAATWRYPDQAVVSPFRPLHRWASQAE